MALNRSFLQAKGELSTSPLGTYDPNGKRLQAEGNILSPSLFASFPCSEEPSLRLPAQDEVPSGISGVSLHPENEPVEKTREGNCGICRIQSEPAHMICLSGIVHPIHAACLREWWIFWALNLRSLFLVPKPTPALLARGFECVRQVCLSEEEIALVVPSFTRRDIEEQIALISESRSTASISPFLPYLAPEGASSVRKAVGSVSAGLGRHGVCTSCKHTVELLDGDEVVLTPCGCRLCVPCFDELTILLSCQVWSTAREEVLKRLLVCFSCGVPLLISPSGWACVERLLSSVGKRSKDMKFAEITRRRFWSLVRGTREDSSVQPANDSAQSCRETTKGREGVPHNTVEMSSMGRGA